MKKMGTSNILIIGLKGLGIEIGKQLVAVSLSTSREMTTMVTNQRYPMMKYHIQPRTSSLLVSRA